MTGIESDVALLAKALVTAMPAAWLTLGVLDNIIHPSVNRDDVARVLALEAVEDWPEVKRQVDHRAITNPTVVRIVFSLVVLGELLATALLWAGSIWLFLAWLGAADAATARDIAMLGAVAFSGVWASFMVGGQWFCYWYGAFGQSTHMLSTLWGLATLIVVAL